MLTAAHPLSGRANSEMRRFIAAASPLMEGGLPAAIDWALLLWIVPMVHDDGKLVQALKPLVQEYPLTAEAL